MLAPVISNDMGANSVLPFSLIQKYHPKELKNDDSSSVHSLTHHHCFMFHYCLLPALAHNKQLETFHLKIITAAAVTFCLITITWISTKTVWIYPILQHMNNFDW